MSLNFSEFELDSSIVRNLQAIDITEATAIQNEVIPNALDGLDILASAATGTGKTFAFLIPIVQHILDFPKFRHDSSRALVLTPTRELSLQIESEAIKLTKGTNINTISLTGGINMSIDDENLNRVPEIIVATPGRLIHHIREQRLDCRYIEILVIDEADRMLDMGFIHDVVKVADEMEHRKQTLLFSATLEGTGLEQFTEHLLNEPIHINVESSRKERKKINEFYYRADDFNHKCQLLVSLLKENEVTKSIVFVKKRERVHELVSLLQQAGIASCYLEGELPQDKRSQAINRIVNNDVTVLIATDVASRGLDIQDISHVFNFDLTRSADVYLHRIGRTARAGKKGTAISLVEAHDYPLLQKIERYTKQLIKRRVVAELKPKSKEPSFKKKNKKNKSKVKTTKNSKKK